MFLPSLISRASTALLRLLCRLVGRLAVHPQGGKGNEAGDGCRDARDPGPGARDDVAAGPLVVGHVADADGALLLDVGEERALVVDHKVEDAVLVRRHELRAVGGGVVRLVDGGEVQAVEGRQHGELELQLILFGEGERHPLVPVVLGQRDGVCL